MARYTEAVCRLCRREGEKLFLKGERCLSPKCSFEKRSYAPGMHGKTNAGRPGRQSDYSKQLRAKQKTRRVYGILERQFRRFYAQAEHTKGQTGSNLLVILETRLSNVVFRLGFATSRAQARILVSHGHFLVNGRRADVPSIELHIDDEVSVAPGSAQNVYFKALREEAQGRSVPTWLARDVNNLTGRVLRYPERSEIDGNLNEQLVVEFYSR